MLLSTELNNFKSFSSQQTVNFSPITLIYGPNSSGKSSIIQSLMMMQQTVLAKDANSRLIPNGDSINLSKFKSLVNGMNLDKTMSFSFKYTHSYDIEEFYLKNNYRNIFGNSKPRTVNFEFDAFESTSKLKELKFEYKRNKNEKLSYTVYRSKVDVGNSTSYTLRDSESKSLRDYVYNATNTSSKSKEAYEFVNSEMTRKLVSDYNLNLPTILSDQSSELGNYLKKVNNDIKDLFLKFKYLGPLRSSPKSIYTNEISNYQKGQGKHNLGIEIYNGGDSLKKSINNYFSMFNIPYSLDVDNLGNDATGDIISIKLKDLRNNTIVGPKDIGFGIGQVLPIILESAVSENKIICVEQPEIHLHPRLQANLADLFVDSVTKEHGNQWIIETHSEALMLRIQKQIREGKISSDLVSFVYVDVGDEGAVITELPLDEDGDFTVHWPSDFFEERLKELS
ncbi:AAA family ATPase [Vibrio splendidus]